MKNQYPLIDSFETPKKNVITKNNPHIIWYTLCLDNFVYIFTEKLWVVCMVMAAEEKTYSCFSRIYKRQSIFCVTLFLL